MKLNISLTINHSKSKLGLQYKSLVDELSGVLFGK